MGQTFPIGTRVVYDGIACTVTAIPGNEPPAGMVHVNGSTRISGYWTVPTDELTVAER